MTVHQPTGNARPTWPAATCSRVATLVAFALLGAASSASGQDARHTVSLEPGAEQPAATVADLAWLIGGWEGEGLGGTVSERWMHADPHTLVGVFVAVGADGVTFYELVTITEAEGSLVMKLKHFNADLTGWEEKDDYEVFPLVKMTSNAAYFDGLTYRLSDTGRLQAYVVVSQSDGSRPEIGFSFHRVDP